jgi:putative methionine-R-sulfoxide reductase with GAF domain
MVDYSANINKTNRRLSSYLTEYNDMWRWRGMYFYNTERKHVYIFSQKQISIEELMHMSC